MDGTFSLCLHVVEGARDLAEVSYKGTNLIQEASTVMTTSSPKDSTSKYLSFGIRFQHINFEEMQTFSGFLDNLVEQKYIYLLVDFQFYSIVQYVCPYASMTLF